MAPNERPDAKEPTILELAEAMAKRLLDLEMALDSRLNRDEVKPESGQGEANKPQSVVGEIINTLQWNITKFDELKVRITCEVLNRIS